MNIQKQLIGTTVVVNVNRDALISHKTTVLYSFDILRKKCNVKFYVFNKELTNKDGKQ